MGVFNLFSRGGFDPKLFETELNTITNNITNSKQQIIKLQSRYKLLKRSLIKYSIIIYLFIFIYCFTTTKHVIATNQIQYFIKGQSKEKLILLFTYPFFSILLIKFIHLLYGFFINNKQKYLKNQQKKHKDKIEELKKITNFNTTNELINKYGEKETPKPQQKVPLTKQDKLKQQAFKELKIPPTANIQTPINDVKNISKSAKQPPNPTAQLQLQNKSEIKKKRTFQDRILDILIGSDNSEAIENRYALICYNCFNHNGLAPPHTEDPLDVKYHCWKCGALNGGGTLFEKELKHEESPKEEFKPKLKEEKDVNQNTNESPKESKPELQEDKVKQEIEKPTIAEKESHIIPEPCTLEVKAEEIIDSNPEPIENLSSKKHTPEMEKVVNE
ncbi:unnamed protein product [Candida verbasci]|uniref:Endoplasmic reticulum junction formation protein lunapark n=1 Tax=Candida verbasci TaxID=1227364 RepID=A0A9W4XH69_9ASCO|nr:unnamed protein product [Candida verbasci]